MPIKFRCPHCEQFLGISENKANTVTDCPTCGRRIRVPALDGTVEPLPLPKMDLGDENLITALNALAALKVSAPEASELSAKAVPIRLNGVSDLPSAKPKAVPPAVPNDEIVAIPVEQASPWEEFSGPSEEALRELARAADPNILSKSQQAIATPFSTRVLYGATASAFLCGLLVGMALRGVPHRETAPSANVVQLEKPSENVIASPVVPRPASAASIQGQITYSGPGGERKPDRGARILLLPLTRSGTSKLNSPGFRVGAEETDRLLLATVSTALGGSFEQADSQGHFHVSVPGEGKYGLVIASRYQSRPESIPISPSCHDFLSRYFDRPEFVIGNVEYQYAQVNLSVSTPVTRDVHFVAR